MVKRQNKDNAERLINQGENGCPVRATKIGPSTAYEYCNERLSPFGGLLGLVKFLDVVQFKEIFDSFYVAPSRTPDLGHYNMVCGIIMLLFIGFNRIWHFLYVRIDPMLCSIFKVVKLPYVTTYWRYVDSLGINQGKSLLNVMSALRERVWQLCGIDHSRIHIDMDTTVETIYGKQQGGRKGHNMKHRGKEGLRPVLCFIEETREYFVGKLRAGKTISGEEVAKLIRSFRKYLPGCVKGVLLRGDGEFIGWEPVKAALEEGYDFIFGNKASNPPFEASGWYKARKKEVYEYNEIMYQPWGWACACRFVGMRMPNGEGSKGGEQLHLLEDEKYTYRIFVTSLKGKPYNVIEEYDKRAACENLIGEAKREGLEAIPSAKFASNYAYFQLVMLAYNIWRYFKMLAERSQAEPHEREKQPECSLKGIVDNTIRIARLKLLLIATKIRSHSGTCTVKYSQHDSRAEGLFGFLAYLDDLRNKVRPWLSGGSWPCRHTASLFSA
jgi:Transposase DDE domain group 1